MSTWKPQHTKSALAKWFKRTVLTLLAFLIFTNSAILSLGQVTATEPEKAALELTMEGQQYYRLGEFDSAARVWQEAADIYQQLGELQHKNQSLINVAEALQANGLYLKACNIVLQAFEIEQFNCLGLTEDNNSDRAFALWFKTLDTQAPTINQANGLHSFGDILQKLGRFDLSGKVLQKGLQIARKLSFSQREGAILLSLGNNQKIIGDRAKASQRNPQQLNDLPLSCTLQTNADAIPFYQQAILLYQQAASKFSSSNAWIKAQLNHLSLLLEIGAKSQAREIIQQVLPRLNELPLESSTIEIRIHLAKNLICLQQNSTAIAFSQSEIENNLTIALQQAQSIGDRRGESYALGYLSWLYEQNQQIAQALSFTQQALFIAQGIQAKDIAYKWQWQLGHILEIQGELQAAIAAYSNAVELHQSLRRDLIAIQTKTQFYFQEQAEPVYRKLVELLIKTPETSPLRQVRLQQARTTIESLRLVELENFLQQACLIPEVEIDRIIDNEDSTSAVIYPIMLQEQLAIILKLPRQPELRYYTTAISQELLENTITQLESYLPDITRTSQVNQLSQQIYDWLISPLEDDLQNSQIETLVFVLDSFLRNIPMSILYNGQQQQYLVEQYAIALAPGLQLIAPQSSNNSSLKVLAAGISQQRLIEGREFTSLINVQQELSQIRSQVSDSEELMDNEFTKTNLQNQLGKNTFSVLHLATHSQFSSNLKETFILLWDRLLRVEDLVNLFETSYAANINPIKLLVLSACQTAKGDKLSSLGLAGITVQAGVSSTLATLWSVDDLSTTQIMDVFYQELNNGATRAKAVQKAQLTFLNQEQRPYFWGAFVLVGNWL